MLLIEVYQHLVRSALFGLLAPFVQSGTPTEWSAGIFLEHIEATWYMADTSNLRYYGHNFVYYTKLLGLSYAEKINTAARILNEIIIQALGTTTVDTTD